MALAASTLAGMPATAQGAARRVAQEAPAGPCSPYRAADGDIPSEMPGCARHRRPAPGSLDDEMTFSRGRHGAEAGDDPGLDDAPAHPRRRPARGR